MEDYAKFQGMRTMSPPSELVKKQQQHRAHISPKGRVPGEGTMINRQTEAFIRAPQMVQEGQAGAAILEDYGPEILCDHASWLWHTSSGLADVSS